MSASSALARLTVYGFISAGIYFAAFVIPYPLESGIEKPLLHFAWLTERAPRPTAMLIAAVAGLFACYIASLRLCQQLQGSRAAFVAVAGFSVLSAAILVRMYPVFSLDVFYYMAADRIWSVFRENPFLVPPLQGSHDPFFPWTAWGHYPLPYGPIWPWITEFTGKFGRGEMLHTLLSFKLLGAVGYLLCLPLIIWTTRALHPERTLTALCLFAWNPLVLLELPGGAHNDAIALPPAILALGLWARRGSVGAAFAGLVSFAVKATVIVLAPALLWASFNRALKSHALVRWTATHVLPGIVLYGLAWIPFLNGGIPVGFLREADQHYQSLTALLVVPMPLAWKDVGLRIVQVILVGGFALYYASQLRALATEGPEAVKAMWRLVTIFFLVISSFYSAWYMVWPTAFAAVLADRRTTSLNTLLCIGGLATYLVQFVVRYVVPPSMESQVNALSLLVAIGPFLVGWAMIPRQGTTRSPIRTARSRRLSEEDATRGPAPSPSGRGRG